MKATFLPTQRVVFSALAAALAAAPVATPPARAQKPQPRVRTTSPVSPAKAVKPSAAASDGFDALTPNGPVGAGFNVIARYTDDAGKPFGARLRHVKTGFYLDLLRIPSAPQGFLWVNTPPVSDRGEPHTQEHLLLGKGNAGRTAASLEGLSLAESNAFTMQWRTCYDFYTTGGTDTFFRLLDSSLNALLNPDYSDEEIRREVRNFGVSQTETGALRLEEKGSVYNEMVGAFGNAGSNLWRAVGQGLYGPESALSWTSGGTPEGIRAMTPAHIRTFHREHYRLDNMGMVASLPPSDNVRASLARFDTVLSGLNTAPPPATTAETKVEGAPVPVTSATPIAETPGATLLLYVKPALAPGTIQRVPYGEKNPENPGDVVFAFPADRVEKADLYDRLLLGLFLDNLGGEADTPLYKKFVDSKTRVLDTGATAVYAWSSDDPGRPVYVSLRNVKPARMTGADLIALRKIVLGEIARVGALGDGSPELRAFNRRALARLAETRRSLRKFTDSPPGFGERNTGSEWMDHLNALAQFGGGATRSVTLKSEIARAQAQLATGKTNLWRARLLSWKLAGPNARLPLTFAAVPDPALDARNEAERAARIKTEVARLETAYGVANEQEAIKRYQADYDKATAVIDAATAEGQAQSKARFVASPPLTLDDTLQFTQIPLSVQDVKIPFVASWFDTMAGGTVGIALSLRPASRRDAFLISALPALMTEAGFIENGKPVSYETARERQKREIQSLSAGFSTNDRHIETGRIELTVTGSGGDLSETRRALYWMRLALVSPDWRPENLPRLRDIVDQNLADARETRQGAEENWARGVHDAVRDERDPLLLSANSFLTRTHNLLRLRWLLTARGASLSAPSGGGDPRPDATLAALTVYLEKLADAPKATTALAAPTRDDLKTLLATLRAGGASARPKSGVAGVLQPLVTDFDALPEAARAVVRDAADDLDQTLADLPDASLAADWSYLCNDVFLLGLQTAPDTTLARLKKLRLGLLNRNQARLWAVGSGANVTALRPDVAKLCADALPYRYSASAFQPGVTPGAPPADPTPPGGVALVTDRVLARGGAEPNAKLDYFGLVNPRGEGGAFVHSASAPGYEDAASRPAVLRFLASKVLSGGGAHSLFMRTWGAGLAYSNGVNASPDAGRVGYYADRTPELSQTLRFVIGEIKAAPQADNGGLAEYAVAQGFSSRAAGSFEGRASAIAANLADGITPARVRAFRLALQDARRDPDLYAKLRPLMEPVYAPLFPGLVPGTIVDPISPEGAGATTADEDRTVLVVIAPPRQLDLYDAYLRRDVSPEARLVRLYPRDFWLTE